MQVVQRILRPRAGRQLPLILSHMYVFYNLHIPYPKPLQLRIAASLETGN